ncbi:hypothetical protein DOJK_00706 [Patescibacteria group bacterium]|nr:hypothetical protein DOJK_00706 [Patescibacteria group bacterium]
MIIILKKISPNTTDYHIETFMAPALKGGFFRSDGHIESISYWKYDIIQTGQAEYYALVHIEPDSAGERVIKQLNKTQLNGKFVFLQEYHARHWSNDRRVFNSVLTRGKNNRRKGDRRRKIIKTEIKRKYDNRLEEITISTHSGVWTELHDVNKKK